MPVTIVPEPPEPEREAILAALAGLDDGPAEGWEHAALAEGAEETELEP